MNDDLVALTHYLDRAQLGQITWTVIQWALLGAGAGFLLGLLLFFVIRSRGGYRSPYKNSLWLQAGFCALNVTLLMGAGLYLGIIEGSVRSIEQGLRQSGAVKALDVQLGETWAPLFATVYYATPQLQSSQRESLNLNRVQKEVLAYTAGQQEIEVPLLRARIHQLDTVLVQQIVRLVETQMQSQWAKDSAILRRIRTWSLEQVAQSMLRQETQKRLLSAGIDLATAQQYLEAMLQSLDQAARHQGSATGVKYGEMVAALAQGDTLIWLLQPIKSSLRSQAILIAGLALFLLLLPVAWLAWQRRNFQHKQITKITG